MYRIKICLLALLIITFASCKKDSNSGASLQLTTSDNGKSATVKKGQTISITLGNPGDGGFSFNTWQYDSSILQLNSHKHIPPANSQLVGDFGSDEWLFIALKSGQTALSITVSRGSADTQTEFANTIKVQ
ncbi:MAG: protease inhibitor I42 family protein [Sphingobacteriales bacterium]